MADDGAFADLRKLSEWFASPSRSAVLLERIARRLGATCVPLLGRELRRTEPARREAAREVLAMLAGTGARARVIVELRGIAADASGDESKVCALGLLAELGEHAAANFANPSAIQRRSALALAAHLDDPGDVASAADLMIRQLVDADLLQMVGVLGDVAPAAARRLAAELALRLDIADTQREAIARIAAALPEVVGEPRRSLRPTHVAVLVDASARIVVVASRKQIGEPRWRRWAVLIGATGTLDDCLHEDDAHGGDADGGPLIANLCADGYRVASTELDHARTIVASAVRRSARANGVLGSSYYLGRDLLDLADAHVVPAQRAPATLLARAHDLLAAGDHAAARALLEAASHAGGDREIAGALGACLLAQNDAAAAIAPLERAIAADPAWPLHHWNLATALHRTGDLAGCARALRRFLATSAAPTGLRDDPDQPARLAYASQLVAALKLTRRRRRRRKD
jgi:hypothetical protein